MRLTLSPNKYGHFALGKPGPAKAPVAPEQESVVNQVNMAISESVIASKFYKAEDLKAAKGEATQDLSPGQAGLFVAQGDKTLDPVPTDVALKYDPANGSLDPLAPVTSLDIQREQERINYRKVNLPSALGGDTSHTLEVFQIAQPNEVSGVPTVAYRFQGNDVLTVLTGEDAQDWHELHRNDDSIAYQKQ